MDFVTETRKQGCFICEALKADDDPASLVLKRGEQVVVMLNKFPYNTAHLLIAPNRHVADPTELTAQESLATMSTLNESLTSIRDSMKPDGFNIGVNLGEVAGAGLPGHLHWHVVPRWAGDTNFMPVVGESKILPESLEDTYARLIAGFAAT
ncbi:MAG: HIT domain-containing protein [Actinomycetota bacterium]